MPDTVLLDNHLAFLASHRGLLSRTDQAIELVGRADFLSCWLPLTSDVELPPTATTVRFVPWSGPGWPERLLAAGFEPGETLVHMVGSSIDVDGAVEVVTVATDQEALDFAEAQSAGFLENEEGPEIDWWRQTFRETALANYRDPDQFFYLIRVDGVPAAVTLMLRTGDVFGIYAVATDPAYRGRGLATALLGQARRDSGGGRLTLQVEVGSDAERLYRKLGFETAFTSRYYRKA